jgi:hypothetical protein
MYSTVRRSSLNALLVMLAGFAAWSAPATAQDESGSRWWLGAGLGGASVNSLAPAPSAGRHALAASVDFGYRLTPQWGLGFEFGAVAPVAGCKDWACAGTASAFAPNFTRLFAFSEFRPRDSGWRFRAGAGASRFCFSRHWSDSAWGWGDTFDVILSAMLDNDSDTETFGGSGGWRCDARMKALGGAVSVGYDWPVSRGAPVAVGLRLSAEAANFGATPAIGLPGFRHRAVMLTLHLNIN